MTHLLHMKCQALTGAPMSEPVIRDHLAQVSGWHLNNGAIEKTFSFKNYHETMAFVNALAWIVHAEDHHPELTVTYNRCTVRWNTHSVSGISDNDFICAARADSVFARAG